MNDKSYIVRNTIEYLMNLNKGYCFESTNKRINCDNHTYIVDLILYNRFMRCHVLVNINGNVGKMYKIKEYYDNYIKFDEENETIGILIDKNKANVIIIPSDNHINSTYFPDKEIIQEIVNHWMKK